MAALSIPSAGSSRAIALQPIDCCPDPSARASGNPPELFPLSQAFLPPWILQTSAALSAQP